MLLLCISCCCSTYGQAQVPCWALSFPRRSPHLTLATTPTHTASMQHDLQQCLVVMLDRCLQHSDAASVSVQLDVDNACYELLASTFVSYAQEAAMLVEACTSYAAALTFYIVHLQQVVPFVLGSCMSAQSSAANCNRHFQTQ